MKRLLLAIGSLFCLPLTQVMVRPVAWTVNGLLNGGRIECDEGGICATCPAAEEKEVVAERG